MEGKQHPDRRDAQFRYINEAVTAFQDDGSRVISVDAKKKENVGNFKNGGAEWAPAGQPERVSVHDFADEELGKAVPYGIYDLTANAGWVNAISHEVIIETISAVTTRTGLTVKAVLDTGIYPQGDQDSRQGHEGIRGPPPPAPPVPRQLELHHPSRPARRHDTPERWELIMRER